MDCNGRRFFLTDLTVRSETDEVVFPWTDKVASDMQSDIAVEGNKITGTLKFIEGGLSPSGPLAGDGNFIALHWSDPDEKATSLKVGLVPSASGMEPVECIDDTDRNGVFKIANTSQKLVITQSGQGHTNQQTFDLTGLTLEDTGA